MTTATATATWKEDRETLRKYAREYDANLGPEHRTFIYVLISHMRNKLHMRSYKGKCAGWRSRFGKLERPEVSAPTRRWARMYGPLADFFYTRACVLTRDDQAAWIQEHVRYAPRALLELVARVLNEAWDAPKEEEWSRSKGVTAPSTSP